MGTIGAMVHTGRRLLVFVTAAALVVVGAAVALTLLVSSAAETARRLEPAREAAAALAELDRRLSAYGEEVATVVLSGRDELPGLQAARVEVTRALARLTQTTRAVISTLATPTEVADALPRFEAVQRIGELYYGIDRSANDAIASQRQMQTEAATQTFRRDVAFRLANEVEPVLDAAIDAATANENAIRTEGEQRWGRLLAGAVLIVALALVATGASGVWLVQGFSADRRATAARLAEAAARMSAAEAQRLDDVKRREVFFADLSHELRTPLTVLRGEADIALRGKTEIAALTRSLLRIRDEAETLSDLLEDLLSLARADGEDEAAPAAPVSVAALVADVHAAAQVLAEAREVTIKTEPGPAELMVSGRLRRLRRAVLNGVDNAIKHTPPGGQVTIRVADQGDRAEISVLDDGPGLLAEEKSRVFERFFRGRGEADLENPGLGIGLAIAREIVLAHGGSIALDNRPEGGARLAIYLPRVGEVVT